MTKELKYSVLNVNELDVRKALVVSIRKKQIKT
jgi:hypothetical protein